MENKENLNHGREEGQEGDTNVVIEDMMKQCEGDKPNDTSCDSGIFSTKHYKVNTEEDGGNDKNGEGGNEDDAINENKDKDW